MEIKLSKSEETCVICDVAHSKLHSGKVYILVFMAMYQKYSCVAWV